MVVYRASGKEHLLFVSGPAWVAAVVIGKLLSTMAADGDIESTLSTSDTFFATPKILFTTPVEDLTRAVIEYGESGVPCVITGFPLAEDDEQSPFRQRTDWMESIYTTRGTPIP